MNIMTAATALITLDSQELREGEFKSSLAHLYSPQVVSYEQIISTVWDLTALSNALVGWDVR